MKKMNASLLLACLAHIVLFRSSSLRRCQLGTASLAADASIYEAAPSKSSKPFIFAYQLALFSVVGTQVAGDAGFNLVGCTLVGCIAGLGGRSILP
jgi:hypothetical protein